MGTKLAKQYYQSEDVVSLARDLLGKVLYTNIDHHVTAGVIAETEAYRGYDDLACHGKICTPRTQVMFEHGGHAYVYLCYGIHALFNIVTNTSGHADAILIRTILPIQGRDIIAQRIGHVWSDNYLINGPGKVSKALGITLQDYGCDLTGDHIWLEDEGYHVPQERIIVGPRVGVEYAGTDSLLPRRFQLHPDFMNQSS